MPAKPGQRIAEAVQCGRHAVAAAQLAPDLERLGEQRERLGVAAKLVLQVPEAVQREALVQLVAERLPDGQRLAQAVPQGKP